MQKKGILFDFDGVVVKSMEQHFTAWKKAFAGFGVQILPEEFYILEGQGVSIISHRLGKNHGLDEQAVERVMERKINYYNQFMHIEFYDYFHDFLDYVIQNNIPRGIVTGGNRERVSGIVNQYFNGKFSCLVTVNDVKRGKPYPDPFLKGAEMLGLSPQECIVIENAPMGIEGAVKAGMTVIAITTTLKAEYLKQAHYIVNDFKEVQKTVQKLM